MSGQFLSDQAAWPPTGGCFCLVCEVFLLVQLARTSSAPDERDLWNQFANLKAGLIRPLCCAFAELEAQLWRVFWKCL